MTGERQMLHSSSKKAKRLTWELQAGQTCLGPGAGPLGTHFWAHEGDWQLSVWIYQG